MYLKILILSFLIISIELNIFPQDNTAPNLVVGIVVDQMRYDYTTRFYNHFGNDGLKRLLNEGTSFTYAHYNYVPTVTGPGHASIYTGTTPFHHGIINNTWFEKSENKEVYCTEDISVHGVGTDSNAGNNSPKRLLTTTITDQLKIATSGKAKVISISIKDRGAILPGGQSADAAYWYDHSSGKFITSTYYMDKLPQWVEDFNNRKLPDNYLSKSWELSLPISEYSISTEDETPYEEDVFSEGKVSFPHSFKNLNSNNKYGKLISTPFGNQLLIELAKTAVENEKLGKNSFTDFLAISFSSPDYIGHAYGPNSVEVQDLYIKFDKQIAELLNYLDASVGKRKYLLFLTSDHAVAENIDFLKKLHIRSGMLNPQKSIDSLKNYLKRNYGDENIFEAVYGKQIYLNKDVILQKKLRVSEIRQAVKDYLYTLPEISQVFTRDDLEKETAHRNSPNLILNGFNFFRSGDLVFELQPNYLAYYSGKGTTHSTKYSYDTHVPIIFYGWHIPVQKINDPVYAIDIAPTISDLLGITEPNACIGITIIK
jgi:predicted AlkP superfamily pyrophosphatase or phosphodiesterase